LTALAIATEQQAQVALAAKCLDVRIAANAKIEIEFHSSAW
jgi:hypothetical protein